MKALKATLLGYNLLFNKALSAKYKVFATLAALVNLATSKLY